MSNDKIISVIFELYHHLNEHEKLRVINVIDASEGRDNGYYPAYEQVYCITEDTSVLAEEAYLEWLENLTK